MMRRSFIGVLVALLGWSAAFAQEITFEATVDRNAVAAGDRLKYTLTLSNAQGQITPPAFPPFVPLGNPGQSTMMNIVNGRMTQSIAYTWYLTAPDKEGTYTIPSASVKVGGGTIQSNPVRIAVSKGAPAAPGTTSVPSGDRNLFVALTLSKSSAFVGEAVTATWTLWSRYQELQLEKTDIPDPEGFWVERIDKGEIHWEDKLRNLNGLQYRVAVLQQQLLFPQKSGSMKVGPAQMSAIVGRSFFDRGERVEFSSNAVELTVKPWPAGRPADLSGATGKLDLSAKLDRTEVSTDEAVTLTVRISGEANLKLLDTPDLQFPVDMEAYEPKVIDKINVTSAGMTGSRTFEWVLIPRHEGEYVLPPITMSYLDASTGTYKSLRSEDLVLTVTQGSTAGQVPGVQRPDRADVQLLENDIRFIRTGDLALRPKGSPLFGSLPYVAGMAAPILAYAGLVLFRRRYETQRADVHGIRRKRADKVARKHLEQAKTALDRGDRTLFHAALSKALRGYLSDKLGLGQAEVTRERLTAGLPDGKDRSDLVNDLMDLLSGSDMARFAPVDQAPQQATYDRAVQLIQRTENLLDQ